MPMPRTDLPSEGVRIRDLRLRAALGPDFESRGEKTELVVNLALAADLAAAGASDDLEDSIDYRGLKKRIIAEIEESVFHTMERIGQRIADICLEGGGAAAVRVSVEARGSGRARRVGICLRRRTPAPLERGGIRNPGTRIKNGE